MVTNPRDNSENMHGPIRYHKHYYYRLVLIDIWLRAPREDYRR
jgi:hypothetical protein